MTISLFTLAGCYIPHMVKSYIIRMLQEPIVVLAVAKGTHSPKFDLIRRWYNRGFWTEEMVMNVVEKNVITIEEAKEILGK